MSRQASHVTVYLTPFWIEKVRPNLFPIGMPKGRACSWSLRAAIMHCSSIVSFWTDLSFG